MNRFFGIQRFLAIYSGMLTLVFAVVVLAAFANPKQKTDFDQITVHRINIVEPDGTLRMVISDKAKFPGIIIRGQEHPHPDRSTAGVLFFNDEGTENGGLTFGGQKGSSHGHLSFDAYEQDQIFTIDAGQQGDKSAEALSLIDRPAYPISELVALTDKIKDYPEAKKKEEITNFLKTHESPHQRLYLGRGADKSVSMRLKDVDGHDRLVVEVAPDGTPQLKFLDANGKVTAEFPPANK